MQHVLDLLCQVFRVENVLLALFGDHRIYVRCDFYYMHIDVAGLLVSAAMWCDTTLARGQLCLLSSRCCASSHCNTSQISCCRNSKGFQRGDFPWRWSFVSLSSPLGRPARATACLLMHSLALCSETPNVPVLPQLQQLAVASPTCIACLRVVRDAPLVIQVWHLEPNVQLAAALGVVGLMHPVAPALQCAWSMLPPEPEILLVEDTKQDARCGVPSLLLHWKLPVWSARCRVHGRYDSLGMSIKGHRSVCSLTPFCWRVTRI